MQKHIDHSTYLYIRFRILLSIVWILGLSLGLYLAIHLQDPSRSLVHTLFRSRVSTVGLCINLFLPIIFSAIVWKLKIPALFLFLAFIKAVGYSFCVCAITYMFYEAGWLLRWLFLFSDTFICALLLWFWFRNITTQTKRGTKDLCICSVLAICILLIDICYVTPFSQGLF